ncbi:MAG: cytochrome c [Rhodospirillales bacterium]
MPACVSSAGDEGFLGDPLRPTWTPASASRMLAAHPGDAQGPPGGGVWRVGAMRLILLAGWLSMLLGLVPTELRAAQPGIEIVTGDRSVKLSRGELLQRGDLTTIDIPRDVTYKRPMTYRAVPLAALLREASLTPERMPGEMIEIVATDGFITVLPPALALPKDETASVPYLAIEPEDVPWPPIPGKTESAGPFYLVWLRPEASGIRSEQWPYRVASVRSTEAPEHRWPELAVNASLPPDSPIRAGQALFLTQCMVCHRLNGAGSADVGPDLNLPQNPTEYLQPAPLRQLIRNPASLRSWPAMQMQGFDDEALSDHDIDLITQYLAHMAGRKKKG